MAADWIHEVRNAVNAATTNAAVVQRLLQAGNIERAIQFNEEVLKACDRSRILLEQPPALLGSAKERSPDAQK